MKQAITSFYVLLIVSSCGNKLSETEKEFSNEFSLYLEDTFNYQIPDDESYLLVINADCYSCNEQFTIDFSEQDVIPNLTPIICGIEGSESIEKSILKIKNKYPNFLVDKKRKIDKYKISESGKNILMKFNKSEPSGYWDLGSGKYSNPKTGQILLTSIIKPNQ